MERCWHCGRLPHLKVTRVAEDAVETLYWCSTEIRDPRTGEALGCGASGPEVEDAYSDPVTAAASWDAYARKKRMAG